MPRVLIVDDKEENLYYLQVLLTGNNCEVITARHGAEALVKARQAPPDVVISDLLMPVMDGYTLLRHWKADAALKKSPFIVYTATYTEAADEELALNLGADAFILKPAEPEDFLARLHEVQNRVSAAGPAQPRSIVGDEKALLKIYSQTLIRKLEEKTLQLEEANRALQQDIAERKLVESSLRASQASMEAAQSIAHFGSWELDLNGEDEPHEGALRWSDEAFRIAGFQPGQVEVSRDLFFKLVHPEDRERVREAVTRAIRERTSYSVVHRLIRPDGEERFIHETAQLFCDEQAGRPLKMIGTAHDITEQRKVEEALQKSEQEQRLLAQQLEIERSRLVAAQSVAKMGSWETDIVTLAVIWSEQTHRIFETDPATFKPTHQDFLDLVHPDDRMEVDAAFARSLHLREAQEIHHRLLMPNGRIKYVTERWQVFHDEHGKPLRALGTTQDITERKLAEAEIRRTTDLLWAVADGMPDAVFVKDLKSRYLLFNQGAARLVGKDVEEVIGQDDTTIFGLEDARYVMDNDREVMASGETRTAEEVLTAAGTTRTYLATKAPYRDGHGNIIGIIGISRDITERKQAEDKIREQATLLDKAQDAILVRDLEHRILYWNRSAERLYGWTAQEVMGRPIKELLYQDPSPFLAATSTVLETGEWVGEIQQFNRDGKTLTIEGRWTLVRDDQGRPKSILAINTDITERKKLEQQFLRAQRMESIGTLAGGIAHDLNNVLAPIMMSIELLRLQEKDPRRLDILATIEGSAKRGADMVRQVLSFARGVEGRQLEVQAKHLLREIEKIVNETFLKSIRVSCDIQPGLWTVTGDPTQLHQVLLNLCVNARDAMPHGGTLSLTASNVTLDEHYAVMNLGAKPGPHVVIHVEDNGSGMPPEVVERIFEPFFTTKELGKGTGLGLSTTLAIVKSHGGFVRVESEPGVGTKFSVFLPARTEAGSQDAVITESELPRGNDELVLVIDDESAVRQITRQTLEIFGYRVLLAADGAEAAGIYAAHRDEVAVVLTDMMMPVMDGPAIIQVLLRINPKVRIISASGISTDSMVSKAINAGVKHFIPKPYSAETLLKTLHQALHEPA